jgi:hypothetical protein
VIQCLLSGTSAVKVPFNTKAFIPVVEPLAGPE